LRGLSESSKSPDFFYRFIKNYKMNEIAVFIPAITIFIVAVLIVLWLYQMNQNIKKLKKLVFALLYLKQKEMKQKGVDIELKDLYERGEEL
jgi:signal transduction histidine kinase